MQVSVEVLNGLQRKMSVSIPAKQFEEEVNLQLRALANKKPVRGFRPGKVPMSHIKRHFSGEARMEAADSLLKKTVIDAMTEKNLIWVAAPEITLDNINEGEDFSYSAVFEVYPEFDVKEPSKDKIELIEAEITEADVQSMLDKIREQNKKWAEVSRAAAQGDKVEIAFEGFTDGKPFKGGSADSHEIIIGSGHMIPGFEEGLVGHKVGKPFEIDLKFPADYPHQELAGKEAQFKITLLKIMAGELPELNDDFAKDFNVKKGGIAALEKELRENMQRELQRRVAVANRDKLFEKLLSINSFDLPLALVNKEIEYLKHEMYHRIFGHEHSDNEKIPDFPRDLFEKKAERRVHLGLLLQEYAKKHEIKASPAEIDAKINEFAEAYEAPDELRKWYKQNKERLQEIESLVIEDAIAQKISEQTEITKISKTYAEIMNPAPAEETKKTAAKDKAKAPKTKIHEPEEMPEKDKKGA